MKNNLVAVITLICTLTLDILTKNFVEKNFNFQDKIDYFDGLLRIALVYNEGGVFGILQGYKKFFLIISIVVLVFMIAYYIFEKNKTLLFSISMALIMSGAIGNIIDRLISHRPGVVDFISIGVDSVYRWPSFNVADAIIIIGAIMLVIIFYKEEKKRKSINSNQQ